MAGVAAWAVASALALHLPLVNCVSAVNGDTTEEALLLQKELKVHFSMDDLTDTQRRALDKDFEAKAASKWAADGNENMTDAVLKIIRGTPPCGAATIPRKLITVELSIRALRDGVDGDFVETGAWTGGSSILMALALEKYDSKNRRLWSADSFQGLPVEDEVRYSHDKATVEQNKAQGHVEGRTVTDHEQADFFGAQPGKMMSSRKVFDENFKQAGLGGNKRLNVLEGWFNETLPKAPIKSISFLRLDGDLYVSTMDALASLYHKISPGGYIYVDDYGSYSGCRTAVDEFRRKNGIHDPMYPILETEAWVQKMKVHEVNKAKVPNDPHDKFYEAVWWRKGR